MKYSKYYQTLLTLTLPVLFMLLNLSSLTAQEDVYVKLANFSIVVETSGDEIKLTCNNGCAWKELRFNASLKTEPQAIDQKGLTTVSRHLVKKDTSPTHFLFTIQRTLDGVRLEGKAGTMWPSLTFDCHGNPCFRSIDEYGVTDQGKK